jgi:hypothetical protein
MPAPETNIRKIARRLAREVWVKVHGGSHDKFEHRADRRATAQAGIDWRRQGHRPEGRMEVGRSP